MGGHHRNPGEGARVGPDGGEDRHRRHQAHRLSARHNGSTPRRGEEVRPRIDRAPLSAGRRRDERPRCRAPRPRHGHPLLRDLRGPLRRPRHPALAAESQSRRRTNAFFTGGAPVEPHSQAGEPGMEGPARGVQVSGRDPRSHHDCVPRESRCRAEAERGLARKVHPAFPLGVLFALSREPWLVLLRLDELGRSGVAQLLSRVDGLPQRLQEHGRPGHGQLGRGVHLQHLRLLHHRGDGAFAGGGVPSPRGDQGRHPSRGAGALRAQKESDRVRRGSGGAACRPHHRS